MKQKRVVGIIMDLGAGPPVQLIREGDMLPRNKKELKKLERDCIREIKKDLKGDLT